MTVPCTNINRKSPIHYRIYKVRQDIHCNLKINVIYLSSNGTSCFERVWGIRNMDVFKHAKNCITVDSPYIYC